MKNMFWGVVGLIAGLIMCFYGLSKGLAPVPTVPTCDGAVMSTTEVCTRTVNGISSDYTYDEKLQLDISSHNSDSNSWYVYEGVGVIFLISGFITISNEQKKKRAMQAQMTRASMPPYPPTNQPPSSWRP
jgi:hypothetical protein